MVRPSAAKSKSCSSPVSSEASSEPVNAEILNVFALRNIDARQALQQRLTAYLDSTRSPVTDNVEQAWDALKKTALSTAADVVGLSKRKHQDWFDESDHQIVPMLHTLHQQHSVWIIAHASVAKKSAYQQSRYEMQRKPRVMKEISEGEMRIMVEIARPRASSGC